MISYDGLKAQLLKRKIKISDLTHLVGISSRTIAKINKNEKIADAVLKRLCTCFECSTLDLCKEYSDNKLLRRLQEEKEFKISGGLYNELQVRITYNSNHIEGSRLIADLQIGTLKKNTL